MYPRTIKISHRVYHSRHDQTLRWAVPHAGENDGDQQVEVKITKKRRKLILYYEEMDENANNNESDFFP